MMMMIIILKTVCARSTILFKYFKEHNGMRTISLCSTLIRRDI